MGQPYHFREKGGIEMQFALKNMSDLDRLSEVDIKNKLSYVADALNLLRTRLGNEKALLGFCGSPWTLACYMIDGELFQRVFQNRWTRKGATRFRQFDGKNHHCLNRLCCNAKRFRSRCYTNFR